MGSALDLFSGWNVPATLFLSRIPTPPGAAIIGKKRLDLIEGRIVSVKASAQHNGVPVIDKHIAVEIIRSWVAASALFETKQLALGHAPQPIFADLINHTLMPGLMLRDKP